MARASYYVFVVLTWAPAAHAAGLPAKVLAEQDKAGQSGDIAWMLGSTGLVLLMVPGLALFYGGMVRRKNVLGTMMQSLVCLALIGLQWGLVGYAIAFGESRGGWIGWSSEFVGLGGESLIDKVFPGTRLPIPLHAMFQGMFAIITPALISGAFAERVRFGPYCLFILLWALLVYDPLAHWVWAADADGKPAGWLGKLGALDFAGGTVVHIAAGFSGLAAILLLRKRAGFPERAMHPNSIVLTLIGAGLLWFGWFGFNGGSALGANPLAASALTATQVAAAAATLAWLGIEWLHRGKPTALGLASGAVAGLVAVTPAAGYITPGAAMIIGAVGGSVCYLAVAIKPKLGYDDSLDAFGIHGVGGLIGAVLTGAFASAVVFKAGSGSDICSEFLNSASPNRIGQIGVQCLAAGVAAVYGVAATFVLIKVIDATIGFTLDSETETTGLDVGIHGETGFDFDAGGEVVAEPTGEPRAASVPPSAGRRFSIVVDGPGNGDVAHAWSGHFRGEPTPVFRAVYPLLTTVQGNRFRFRGGDPDVLRRQIEQLIGEKLPASDSRRVWNRDQRS